ncbi:ROK family protein [Granulosicoccaceae sp. 1_MG-2023]|nr:ROK family protein [Granulosicoccaceae sp. 1_MG-2023]
MTQTHITASGPGRIRQQNRRAVLEHLRYHGDAPRSALGAALGLSAAAVSSVTNELLDDGLLLEPATPPAARRQGRPVSPLSLNPEAAFALGLLLRPALDHLCLETAWVDYAGRIRVTGQTRAPLPGSADELQRLAADAIDALSGEVPHTARIRRLCVGIPGVVSADSIPIAPKLQAACGEGFIRALQAHCRWPVSFHNDVNLAATSELHQQPRLRQCNFAYLHVYAGIGSGIVLRGQVLGGSAGWAGELGQLRITRGTQRPSFEELLSTDGSLAALLSSLGEAPADLDALSRYIDQRDERVLPVIDQYCEHLSDAIRVLHSVLDLDEVLLDFPGDALFRRIRPRLDVLLQDMAHPVSVTSPVMGHHAALHGAALSALSESLPAIEQRHESA